MNKNKNFYKIILDIIMTVIIVVLMKTTFTGMLWHEILGIGVFLLFIFHKLINFKTLSCLIKKFKKVPAKSKSMLILDILLFIDFIIVVATGILISQELFSSYFSLANAYLISTIHHSSAYIGLILISVHIGLHWSCIMSIVKTKLHLKDVSRIRTVFSRMVAIAIMLFGIQSSYDQNVLSTVAQPLSAGSTSLAASSDSTEDLLLSEESTASADTSQTAVAYSVSTSSEITLDEYLSNLYCTACSRHCPLSSPQCSKGVVQAKEATTEYYSIYGDSSTTADTPSTDNTTTDDSTNEEATHQNGKRNSQEDSTENDDTEDTTSEDSTTSSQEDTAAEDISATASSLPLENTLDYISIMGFYIGGTHYLVKIPRKKK